MPDSSVTRANVRMKFYNRFILLGLGALAGGLYFIYDGMITYPHQRQVWDVYVELYPEAASDHHHGEEHGEEDAAETPEDFPQEAWDEMVLSKGWEKSVKPREVEEGNPPSFGEPKGKHWTDWKIKEQLVIGGLLVPISLAFFAKVLLARGMWVESDGQQVTSSWGKGFHFDDVIEINKKKWADKGLAYIKFRGERNGTKTFVIDDLKFHRKPTDAILYELEQAVGVDKIIGGPPEAAPSREPASEAGDPAKSVDAEVE